MPSTRLESETPSGRSIDNGLFLSRKASGLLLASTYRRLRPIELKCVGIELNSPYAKDQTVTEVPIIRVKESKRETNIAALRSAGLRKYEILAKLLEKVPTIGQGKDVTVEDVHINYDASNAHESFASFTVDSKSALWLQMERIEVWEGLEDIVGKPLDWGDPNPEVRVIYADDSISELGMKALGAVMTSQIKRPGSNKITLAPAFRPEADYFAIK